jgi:DNA uptake protein ComE-like DNA-binding protein
MTGLSAETEQEAGHSRYMINRKLIHKNKGVVLLITLVVLVVLASLGYTLTTRIAAQIHRDQYIIDYQNARYACDSGLKYTLMRIEGIKIKPIDRPNDPDFSDVFGMTDEQYQRYLRQWAAEHPLTEDSEQYAEQGDANDINDVNSPMLDQNSLGSDNSSFSELLGEYNDVNDSNDNNTFVRDPNKIVIPGPYGPPWPMVIAPIEIEIGTAKVKIEIEDENAKLPLIWGANTDKEKQQEVDASLTSFGEWMNMSYSQIDDLKQDLKNIGELKPYTAGTPISAGQTASASDTNGPNQNAIPTPPSRSRRRAALQQRLRQQQQNQAQQVVQQNNTVDNQAADFVRLMHSSLINTEQLAQPYFKTEQRTESILKYVSRWGASQVNINTAPRNVLEAAFMFGGDAPAVSDAIIKARQKEPFKDVNDLQKKIYKYADTIRKSKDFITASSNVLSIKITAVSGVATSTATAAVLLEGKKARIIAIIAE